LSEKASDDMTFNFNIDEKELARERAFQAKEMS
jgi:hypothetical protein